MAAQSDEPIPSRLSHADCKLWAEASVAVFSPDTSDAVKQIALSIRETLRLQSQVEELDSIRAMILVNFGPDAKDPLISDTKQDTERLLYDVLTALTSATTTIRRGT